MAASEPLLNIAVLILNWNGRRWLEQFLPGVISNSKQAEVIVADNGSTDDSVQWLEQNFPDLRILKLDENYGFTGGYNKAMEMINHPYVVLLNNDVDVSENWLDTPIEYLQNHPGCAALQPKILSYSDPEYFEYAGASGGFLDRFGYPFCRGRIFNHIEKDKGQYDNPRPVLWATGACMMIRRQLFVEAGGFDADFFAHMEEIDLCWRLKRMGYDIICLPDVKVWHVGGGSLKQGTPRKTFLNFRNSLITLHKNAGSNVFFLIITRLFLDGLAGCKILFSDGPAHFMAIISAHWSYFTSIGRTIKKRRTLKNITTQKKVDCIIKGSIVALHYLKKIRRFSDIPDNCRNEK